MDNCRNRKKRDTEINVVVFVQTLSSGEKDLAYEFLACNTIPNG